MNKLCQIINDNINLDYDISFYIKQTPEDMISYDYYNLDDTINYICDNLYDNIIGINSDMIIYNNNDNNNNDNNNDNIKIVFLYNDRKCTITKKYWTDEYLYWILYIDLI
jgi:hypothetical protein